MNEKFPVPQADRLVGGDTELSTEGRGRLSKMLEMTEDEHLDAKEAFGRIFKEFSGKPIEDIEPEKTEKDKAIIALATSSVKAFAREFGREEFEDLPIENIHYLSDGGVEKFTKGRLATGSHATVLGQVLVDRQEDLDTAITTFHELWHAIGSYKAVQVAKGGTLEWYRSGFSVKSRDAQKDWFYRLDEGLTGFMTKRFVEEVLEENLEFKKLIEEKGADGEEVDTTRRGEVKLLHQIADAVYEKNKDSFKSSEEVINMFLRAQVTGNVLPVARLVEKTFGKGVFRHMGEVTQK